ncbi:MAG: NAD(+) kinase [Acidobacteria bacterium]|nr:MAG: NAD(+) kinase [Acidobacteriota bacterium]
MKAIAVIPHPERQAAYELANQLAEHLMKNGIEVRIPEAEAAAMDRSDLGIPDHGIAEGLDLSVSVGGDGTMLRAVSLSRGVPVLGVNLGALGFLAEVEPEEATAAVMRLADGEYEVEERMTIDGTVSVKGEVVGESHRALNEITVEKQNAERMIGIDLNVNGEPFISFRADGVVVATPTGSTAYAFSLRGPIMTPSMKCISVVPIAPHGLFDRTVVLAPWEEVEVIVKGDRPAAVAVDGRRKVMLDSGGEVKIVAGAEPARFVRFEPHKFHRVLRDKFGLRRETDSRR